ncbi:TQO small subunit DoxD [Flavobacterium aquidurense]|uniref:TQO small subunit DoxD domain-containing protein n=1 Tax=Flavobacterium aquidurense TaxID=362413 RepID=A0A0N8VNP5_9FLAO|nr:TQO small subunit DoxD [Flavobacterium aquidurense]KQB42700.1 TQO small subunit DoxD domain-containing protein [Flavobacterium aquidurense]
MNNQTYLYGGMFTTTLRWVAGWTYFSAFWRRLILENKLNPDEAGYIGEKFNHFLPNALGIKPIIEHLVSNPESLWWAMVSFTVIEGIVGLLFMFGLFTRLMSIGVFGLAFGILLGSGWLGTTCLDEWQIGILGVAAGFTIFMSGGGKYSMDEYFIRKNKSFTAKKWFRLLGSGVLPLKDNIANKLVLAGSVFILALTLFTNQYFHGGVYGKLHNLSVKPHVTISNAFIQNNTLSFTVFRDEGADVYGSFLIGIKLIDQQGNIIFEQNQAQLSHLAKEQIKNDYVARVKPGKHSLILPLGAKATLNFKIASIRNTTDKYILELIDISGEKWTQEITL